MEELSLAAATREYRISLLNKFWANASMKPNIIRTITIQLIYYLTWPALISLWTSTYLNVVSARPMLFKRKLRKIGQVIFF